METSGTNIDSIEIRVIRDDQEFFNGYTEEGKRSMKAMTEHPHFDELGRFIIEDFPKQRPFSSFLPGIAGPWGIPMWVFYVNRGQAIASFGTENKDNPMMEFLPANKAYQTTPYTGFRTFLKVKHGEDTLLYEPFSPWQSDRSDQMLIGMNELGLRTFSAKHGLQTDVLYFTLPGEDFAGLARQVTVTNTGNQAVSLEMLDGLSRMMPYGVDNWGLKYIGRTLEAWMEVFHLDEGIPFYRLRASAGDTAEVATIQAGHFYLATRADQDGSLPMFVDPTIIFGQNTTLSFPDRFAMHSLNELAGQSQITVGRTPCGFVGVSTELNPGQSVTVNTLIGLTRDIEHLRRHRQRITQPDYLRTKRDEARQLVQDLTDVVDTQTGSPLFDAYCRQTFLDNVLRGGWPLILGDGSSRSVYHIYSRKHGDLERDYNDFYVAAEMLSQGNGNYRDVNQNRRCDVLLNPQVEDFNIKTFLGLIQADGYNPLVVHGSRFTVPAKNRALILTLADQPDKLESVLAQPFTLGQLLRTIADQSIELTVALEDFIATILEHAEQHFEATFGEGYWVDHWFYNLDLIDTYLAVYPDREDELLFGKPTIPFFDSPGVVQPRSRQHVLVDDGKVRQYGAVHEDGEKIALIASRTETPNLVRTAHGQGEVYRTTVFAKLLGLALIKFATLDPLGMGIEMEAGRPGWYDALNGLPGLFGSSLSETYELERLLTYLLESIAGRDEQAVLLPVEQSWLLQQTAQALDTWESSADSNRDYNHWDTVATIRETHRERVRLGFDGEIQSLRLGDLAPTLTAFRAKAQAGIEHALYLNDGTPPTYLTYTVTDYEVITGSDGQPQCDGQGRPYVRVKALEPVVLPLFLEGPMHALKVQTDSTAARKLHTRVRESNLFDRKLRMYKVNAPLANQSHEIGRARAFPPGWLENESVWLHMEYKYLFALLKASLYEEFFEAFRSALVPFQNPSVYGRSPLENSSFIASSMHPDPSLHGTGFVARLSGSTAEFMSIWTTMMAGGQPFQVEDDQLRLAFRPALPAWLFAEDDTISFRFLGQCTVIYHNPERQDTFTEGAQIRRIELHTAGKDLIEIEGDIIGAPYARMVRDGQVGRIEAYFGIPENSTQARQEASL